MDDIKPEYTRETLQIELSTMSLDELSYILGCYCGPRKTILREKKYGYYLAKDVESIVRRTYAARELDEFLMDEMLSDNE